MLLSGYGCDVIQMGMVVDMYFLDLIWWTEVEVEA
jgi:hypothetical protein